MNMVELELGYHCCPVNSVKQVTQSEESREMWPYGLTMECLNLSGVLTGSS